MLMLKDKKLKGNKKSNGKLSYILNNLVKRF